MLVIKKFNSVGTRKNYASEFNVIKVEGVEELEALCPRSKLTGFPMSLQASIKMITDKNSRLADVLLQEIPTINASEEISDNDKFKLLVSRLDSGSFFENDKVAEILGDVAKEFFPEADVDKVVADAKIQFSGESDGSVTDAE